MHTASTLTVLRRTGLAALAAGALLGVLATASADDPRPLPNPAEPVSYVKWLNDHFGAAIPKQANAADRYEQGMRVLSESEQAAHLAERPLNKLDDAELSSVRAWVKNNERALLELVNGAAMEKCYFKRSSKSEELRDNVLFPARRALHLAQVAVTRAKFKLVEGDVRGATVDFCAAVRFVAHLREQPSFMEYFIASSIGSEVNAALLLLPTMVRDRDNFDYQAVLKNIEGIDRPVAQPELQLKMETLLLWDYMQRTVETGGDEAAAREIDRLYQEWTNVFKADWADARKQADELARKHAQRGEKDDAVGKVMAFAKPQLLKVSEMQRRAEAEQRGVRLVLLVFSHHAKNGQWPKELNDALDGRPEQLTIDPFSAKPFAYRVDGDNFTLYSVSLNGADDGGKRSETERAWSGEGDFVFWPPKPVPAEPETPQPTP
ncbi:MAG: hypothetical protein CHACPFDD_02686 [Phycisphaerae bacterium]|nr:hypothetical protein [Phycisphaerae bacterium]